MKLDLSFRNAGALAANFRAADVELQTQVREVVRESGEFCRELAFFLCPVDTGFMRNHLTTIYSEGGLVFETGWLEADFTEAGLPFYPPFQEFGTRFMAAQPSLSPAYRETKEHFRAELSKSIRDSFARLGRLQ